MSGIYRDVFRSLVQRELLLPYFKNAVLANDWPDSYTIEVDSSPYYGFGDGYFHPSTHCVTTNFNLAGARYLFYLFHPEYREKMLFEQRDVQDEMQLAMGSALHAVVQTQFVQAGLVLPEDIEVEYVIPDHQVRGRIDFIVDHPTGERIPVEFKTQNARAFNFQKEVKPEWDAQLSMGLHGVDADYGVLLVAEAGHPYRMKEFKVQRNDALLEELFAKFDEVREAVATDTPPPHCCPKGSPDNKRCPARYLCWDRGKVAR